MAETLNPRAGIGMTSARTRGRMVERLREQGIKDETVLTAMGAVPRHLFVDQALESRAYEDNALPIGFGQTISNPYIVARMAELARHGEAGQGRPLGRVLEIGLGCGYQAAILAKLAREVVSMERIAALVGKTRVRLRELRINNVKPKHGDGLNGARDFAPFDAIVVSAAFPEVPRDLLDQLADGGRLVMPRGGAAQALCVMERQGDTCTERVLEDVKFVPLLPGVA
ncbi:protein-L-isoaspartate(D-aspartate) O-methyltransferase [Betaproteobacteria bacterium SCN1]|jgi:protein-L-isoaspartate(D-aspartate) O-methyltransferase|nr:protein-L-isoaspartate(D-aspartate) O-methyltransferase [Betaproteobacteria bacterium SCN1]MBN8759363.1 protein-L-isoaspartate(D-aspartate) O-methyltransferase [Thiobacillus sp.]ODU90301.1 MAG: protein-L-isoaspartate O-methyltransferase [Thiobacillus sp. SCN 65-179]OJW34807.1 MAG: protein-L-isoaspartate O-methyltransferase [Thiobacillus sp. 65-69]